MEYAMEADPGRLTVSFPTFATYEAARAAADAGCMYREGVPPVRVLERAAGGSWKLADTEEAAA